MAGMQYYFFPTDFFYPKPPSVATTQRPLHQEVVPLKPLSINAAERPLLREAVPARPSVHGADEDDGSADKNSAGYKIAKALAQLTTASQRNVFSKQSTAKI